MLLGHLIISVTSWRGALVMVVIWKVWKVAIGGNMAILAGGRYGGLRGVAAVDSVLGSGRVTRVTHARESRLKRSSQLHFFARIRLTAISEVAILRIRILVRECLRLLGVEFFLLDLQERLGGSIFRDSFELLELDRVGRLVGWFSRVPLWQPNEIYTVVVGIDDGVERIALGITDFIGVRLMQVKITHVRLVDVLADLRQWWVIDHPLATMMLSATRVVAKRGCERIESR